MKPEKENLLNSEEMQLVDEARETEPYKGFISELFLGNVRFDLLEPFPKPCKEDSEKAEQFLHDLKTFFLGKVDPNAMDRDSNIPDDVIQECRDRGLFNLKNPTRYGGPGYSQSNYRRIFELIGSWSGNMVALTAPPNSIGIFVPILKFGTEEQKNKYLPELAHGKISAFALTEKEAGSDPSRVKTTAERVYKNGELIGYHLNGEKLYITCAVKADNVPLAEYVVVVARITEKSWPEKKKLRGKFGLFLVDAKSKGYATPYRFHHMGLRSICNGVLTFKDVFVLKENIIGNEGDGLKIAMQSLSVGRLTIAASCVGGLKQALQIGRWRCKKRVQWKKPIGEHEATGAQLVRIACLTMVTDALVRYCSVLVDQKKDIRIESIFTKVLSTEHLWEALCLLMRIGGGGFYETYYSLTGRGEVGIPVERMLRDAWVNLIFEGENKVTTLFGGMEGMREYITRGLRRERSKWPITKDDFWFLKQLAKSMQRMKGKTHRQFIRKEAKKLVYQLLRAAIRYGTGLQHKQLVANCLINRAAYLFLMSLVLSYAKSQYDKPLAKELADYFCDLVREELSGKNYTTEWILQGSHLKVENLAKRLMAGEAKWLEESIISALEREGVDV